jgi:hypothetical protein
VAGATELTAVFRVADLSRKGLVSWEDFVVFETCMCTYDKADDSAKTSRCRLSARILRL